MPIGTKKTKTGAHKVCYYDTSHGPLASMMTFDCEIRILIQRLLYLLKIYFETLAYERIYFLFSI